jgi:hypothetical protein
LTALALITSLGKEGKTPLEIARELHARGVTSERGKPVTPDMVAGCLRFHGVPVVEREDVPVIAAGAVWGSRRQESNAIGTPEPKPEKKRRNRRNPGTSFSDRQKAEIARLYQQEKLKPAEIAMRLGISLGRVNTLVAYLAGFSVPPGDIEEYIDAEGHRVLKCPPGYAWGANPQRNVRPTKGGA